jgi:hypothetical protein
MAPGPEDEDEKERVRHARGLWFRWCRDCKQGIDSNPIDNSTTDNIQHPNWLPIDNTQPAHNIWYSTNSQHTTSNGQRAANTTSNRQHAADMPRPMCNTQPKKGNTQPLLMVALVFFLHTLIESLFAFWQLLCTMLVRFEEPLARNTSLKRPS